MNSILKRLLLFLLKIYPLIRRWINWRSFVNYVEEEVQKCKSNDLKRLLMGKSRLNLTPSVVQTGDLL